MRVFLLTSAAMLLTACATTPSADEVATQAAVADVMANAAAIDADAAAVAADRAASSEPRDLSHLGEMARPSGSPLEPWTGPYGGVPPWDEVTPERLAAAFQPALDARQAEIENIAVQTAAPTFDNTILELEDSGRPLGRLQALFGVQTSNVSTPAWRALEAEWQPRFAAAADRITFNRPLFARIDAVHAARKASGLTAEQRRLVEKVHARYVRRGARLTPEQQAEVGRLNQRLAALYADFSAKLLADEQTFITLTEAQTAGLSDALKASFRAAAVERSLPAGAYAVVNTRSAVDPFLTQAHDRALRQQVWTAFKARGDGGDAEDTKALIAEITTVRQERAKRLGFKNHAWYRMDDTMARDPAKARALMDRVWPAAVARVQQEVADMAPLVARDGAGRVEPWDYLYYAEQVRKAKYDLDQNELKLYFELSNMQQAAFWTANQLYGLTFTALPAGAVPVFVPDVKVYEVKDRDGRTLGLFYADNFARSGKRSGAWMTTYRARDTLSGQPTLILASNNNNFVQGAPGEPVLISLDDAETLFHEFGHALHFLLSEVNYPALGDTPRDYVEYPSQVLEHWVLTRPVLDRFARHHRTGAPMPQALVDKVKASQTFNQGYATVEYLSSALVDMAMHDRADGVADPAAFERDTLSALGMPREVAMRHRLPQFGHLFSGDSYSAGYYSYLWSEVMDADTWAAFEDSANIFDPALAAKMRSLILAPGDSSDRAEAFRQLRGRDPDVSALLKVRGFPTERSR